MNNITTVLTSLGGDIQSTRSERNVNENCVFCKKRDCEATKGCTILDDNKIFRDKDLAKIIVL